MVKHFKTLQQAEDYLRMVETFYKNAGFMVIWQCGFIQSMFYMTLCISSQEMTHSHDSYGHYLMCMTPLVVLSLGVMNWLRVVTPMAAALDVYDTIDVLSF